MSAASSTRWAARAPWSSATSTIRTELDEFAEPTTRNRSARGADRLHRGLPVLRRVADVVARRRVQRREPLPQRRDRLQRLVHRQRGLGQPDDLVRIADLHGRRVRRPVDERGRLRAPRRRCRRPPRAPRARSAGSRSPPGRSGGPRCAPWSPAGRSRRSCAGCGPPPPRAPPARHRARRRPRWRPRAPRRSRRRRSPRAPPAPARRAGCARSACARRPGRRRARGSARPSGPPGRPRRSSRAGVASRTFLGAVGIMPRWYVRGYGRASGSAWGTLWA